MNIFGIGQSKATEHLEEKLAWAKSSLKQFAISRLILSKS